MRITSTVLFACLALSSLLGQTTITNATLPAVGDSFYYAVDTAFLSISYGVPGPNQTWDFSKVGRTASRSEVYRKASTGALSASFPTADAVVITGPTEQYYRFYLNRIELLGTATRGAGPLPGLGGANVFPKPAVIQRYPEKYGDSLSYSIANSVALPASILPDSILNTLPIKPDSFRIVFSTKYSKHADAWGTLVLPAKTWNVLREKRSTTTSTSVEAKVPLFGWLDVTALASGIFGGFFGNINSNSYAFVSNETKGLIASINVDTLGNVTSISYKPDDKVQTKTEQEELSNVISLSPNPCNHLLTISSGTQQLYVSRFSIADASGRILKTEDLEMQGSPSSTIDIHSLPDGVYFLNIIGTAGQNLGTRPFVVKH